MSKRKDADLLEDIKESIKKIISYVKEIDHRTFVENSMMHDAVIRNLEIIGEATKNISVELKSRHPNIPWRKMVQLRDVLIHQYEGVNLDVIWEIVEKSLINLAHQMEEICKKEC